MLGNVVLAEVLLPIKKLTDYTPNDKSHPSND